VSIRGLKLLFYLHVEIPAEGVRGRGIKAVAFVGKWRVGIEDVVNTEREGGVCQPITNPAGSALPRWGNRFFTYDLFTVFGVTRSRGLGGHLFGRTEFIGDLPIPGGQTADPVHKTIRLYRSAWIRAFEVAGSVPLKLSLAS
jgi:hypothetical protein